MLGMQYKLQKLENLGTPIMTGIVGAGQMGSGMIAQMTVMKGIRPAVVADIDVNRAINAFKAAGIGEDAFKVTDKLSEANDFLKRGIFVATANSDIAIQAEAVQAVVDATGVPDIGAKVAFDSIMNRKHIVLLTVETDIVVGPILNRLARNAGVVYTGSAGDEPGVVKEMFDWAVSMGLEVRAMGKGIFNALDFHINPDICRPEAEARGMNPKMLCSFKDNTKTAVEFTAMSNATGCVSDIQGAHRGKMPISEIGKFLSLKEEGGVLSRYGVVAHIDGVQPGVFIMVSSSSEKVREELSYVMMGAKGPNFVIHKPYHLCSMETPLTVAKAVIDNIPTITPIDGMISETITVAKADIKAGSNLDGIGGFTVRGVIDSYENSKKLNAVPLSLITSKTKVVKDIKQDDVVRMDMLEMDKTTFIYKLREMQDIMFKQ